MNKYKMTIVIIFILCITLQACTNKFDEKNTNKHAATDDHLKQDNLAVGSLISQMQLQVFPCITKSQNVDVNNYQLMYSLAGDIYSGHQGASNAFSNACINNTTYEMTPDWYSRAFSVAYQNSMTPWFELKLKKDLTPTGYAIGQIMRVLMMHRITDMYGPLPYKDFVPSSNMEYTSQDSIYYSFFEDLDEATNTLNEYIQNNPGAKPLANYDKYYKGDFTKWVLFANSLKLRLAMRIVYADEEKAKKYAEEAIAGGVFISNDDNAMLEVDGSSTVNPLYMICHSYDDTRMGATMESFMRGYNDPRVKLLFMESEFEDDPYRYNGVRTGIIFDGQEYKVCSKLNVTAKTPIQIMTAAEVYFLRAEAALRGWTANGTPKELYEQGVKTAFSQKIGGDLSPAGDATQYLNDATSKPAEYEDLLIPYYGMEPISQITIKWNESDEFETNLNRIITQKWIALFPDGQEAWSEFRRTGFPNIFPVFYNFSSGKIDDEIQIRRLPFPQDEYLNNPEGVKTGIQKLGGDDSGGTRLWWDKKTSK